MLSSLQQLSQIPIAVASTHPFQNCSLDARNPCVFKLKAELTSVAKVTFKEICYEPVLGAH